MTFRDFLKNNKVVLDGGTGTLLQKVGIPAGVSTEEWNLTHPDELVKIHKAYYDAGSNIVMTNTFGVNAFKFSEEEIEKFFERFYRADQSRNSAGGSGLGLAISKQIVELHNGKIEVTSNKDKTIFKVSLPLDME